MKTEEIKLKYKDATRVSIKEGNQTFYFTIPTVAMIERFRDTNNLLKASKNLCIDTVITEDRENLEKFFLGKIGYCESIASEILAQIGFGKSVTLENL